MDPIVVNNEAINETKKEVVDMINEHFPGVTIHDFRMIQVQPIRTDLRCVVHSSMGKRTKR